MATHKAKARDVTEAPRAACVFECPRGALQFTAEDPADEAGGFKIVAYDGGITQHWYWGQFAIDLDGLSFKTDPLPILQSHWTSDRMGFTTSQTIGDKVSVEGRFLRNDRAQELRRDMGDGFPMQASLAGDPKVVEQVPDGASAKVNGKTLNGPGAIWRKASIYEISMTPFGALENTRTIAFAGDGEQVVKFDVYKETDMNENAQKDTAAPPTVEWLKTDHPDLYAEAHAAGVTESRSQFAALQDACEDDAALLVQAFKDGWDPTKALKERNARLRSQLVKAREMAKPVTGASVADPAVQEFISQPAAGEEADPFDEETATEEQLREQFAKSPELQGEFGRQADAYVSFVKAERAGTVRIK